MSLRCTILTLLVLSLPIIIEGFQVAFTLGDHAVSARSAGLERSSNSSASSPSRRTLILPHQDPTHAAGRCRPSSSSSSSSSTTALSMVDPATAFTAFGEMDALMASLVGSGPEIGAAVIGAAAGALSQVPRINQLNEQITQLKMELELSQANMTSKISLLEDKLFEMDKEFEDQTAHFKRQYDTTQRAQLEQIKEKIKREYQFKLEIQTEERKSAELMKQIDKEHKRTSQQQELSVLSLQKQRAEEANAKLEKALQQTADELKRMMEEAAAKARKRFFLF